MKTLVDLLQTNLLRILKLPVALSTFTAYIIKCSQKARVEQIYDISAMRVLVPTVDGATVMGILHHTWQHIPGNLMICSQPNQMVINPAHRRDGPRQ